MSATVVLIQPRLKSWSPNVWVPLGPAYVAAALLQAGYEVQIVDLNAERLSEERLRKRIAGADVVGISGMITEYKEVLELVRLVKDANDCTKVILGGPLATTLPRKLLEVTRADFVVIGEGEGSAVELMSAITGGTPLDAVRGIAYRRGSEIVVTEPRAPIADADTIPMPARQLLNMERYVKNHFKSFGYQIDGIKRIRSTNLITSRGCPYSCTFCLKEMWGHKWRGRSSENIVQEMEQLHSQYGINGFHFVDDTFVMDRKRVLSFCDLLRKRGLNVIWDCNGRINLMNTEMLSAMYSAGCRGISYGIESGSQPVLDSIKKGITLDQVRQVVGLTKSAGINVCGYFMIGMLDETKDSIEKTISFASELDLDFYGFSITTPLPGTQLFDEAASRGLISRRPSEVVGEWSLHANSNLTRDCTNEELVAYSSRAFKDMVVKKRGGKFYMLNPRFIAESLGVILSVRNMGQARELAAKARSVFASSGKR